MRSRIVYKSACPSELRKDPSWLQSRSHTTTTSGIHAANTVMLVGPRMPGSIHDADGGGPSGVRETFRSRAWPCMFLSQAKYAHSEWLRTENDQSLLSSVLSSFARSLIGSGRDSFGRLRYHVITCSEPLSRFGVGWFLLCVPLASMTYQQLCPSQLSTCHSEGDSMQIRVSKLHSLSITHSQSYYHCYESYQRTPNSYSSSLIHIVPRFTEPSDSACESESSDANCIVPSPAPSVEASVPLFGTPNAPRSRRNRDIRIVVSLERAC